ncbi:MAG TPA: glycosyltransferase family 2 protein [Geobacteraceae bacterium]|nr:glycosyltransferase family 2 protein [Geobacteraceae bacterium]
MKRNTSPPELSIIVPVLNESALLPALFQTIAGQERTAIELIICDGGSADGSADLARGLGDEAGFRVIVTSCERGRGRQLNAGAALSSAPTLLFLHADSRFAGCLALRTALDLLAGTAADRGHDRVAGRFPLRFVRSSTEPSLPYYYYECKARLDRPGCIHGDQGLMLRTAFFLDTGPFEPYPPMLAETRFADTVRHSGEWLLFPVEIFTSARRFESEGLHGRQALNAIIMNAAAIGWKDFFQKFSLIYTDNDGNGRPVTATVLRAIRGLVAALPARERLSLWYATGGYVLANAWQVPFFLDTRRNFRRGLPAGNCNHPLLDLHDRHLARLLSHGPGRMLAAALAWLWFQATSRCADALFRKRG